MIAGIIGTLIAALIVWIVIEVLKFFKFDRGAFILNESHIDATRWQVYKTFNFWKRVRTFMTWRYQGRL